MSQNACVVLSVPSGMGRLRASLPLSSTWIWSSARYSAIRVGVIMNVWVVAVSVKGRPFAIVLRRPGHRLLQLGEERQLWQAVDRELIEEVGGPIWVC